MVRLMKECNRLFVKNPYKKIQWTHWTLKCLLDIWLVDCPLDPMDEWNIQWTFQLEIAWMYSIGFIASHAINELYNVSVKLEDLLG